MSGIACFCPHCGRPASREGQTIECADCRSQMDVRDEPLANPRGSVGRLAVVLLCLIAAGIGGLWLNTAVARSADAIKAAKCMSALRELGQQVLRYADSHDDEFPRSWADLESLGSPASQARMREVLVDGRLPYVYIGAGLRRVSAPSDLIIAYEPAPVHEGLSVLYANGDVKQLTWRESVIALNKVSDQRRCSRRKPPSPGDVADR